MNKTQIIKIVILSIVLVLILTLLICNWCGVFAKAQTVNENPNQSIFTLNNAEINLADFRYEADETYYNLNGVIQFDDITEIDYIINTNSVEYDYSTYEAIHYTLINEEELTLTTYLSYIIENNNSQQIFQNKTPIYLYYKDLGARNNGNINNSKIHIDYIANIWCYENSGDESLNFLIRQIDISSTNNVEYYVLLSLVWRSDITYLTYQGYVWEPQSIPNIDIDRNAPLQTYIDATSEMIEYYNGYPNTLIKAINAIRTEEGINNSEQLNEQYQLGLQAGRLQSTQGAYNDGWNEGYAKGKTDGIELASSVGGKDVVNSLESTKAIIRSIVEALNIKIFGTIGLLDILSIVIVLGIVTYIIKLARG